MTAGLLLGQFPTTLPAPTTVYKELKLTVDLPKVTHGQPWLHVSRDGADWGGYWHLMGWNAEPSIGPDYQNITLYLIREPPGNGKLVAFLVTAPAFTGYGTATAITGLVLDTNKPATPANRDWGLGPLWTLCEGVP